MQRVEQIRGGLLQSFGGTDQCTECRRARGVRGDSRIELTDDPVELCPCGEQFGPAVVGDRFDRGENAERLL